MSEDPAVAKARTLWNNKQPKEAMLILVNRINELNSQIQNTTATHKDSYSPPQFTPHPPVSRTEPIDPGTGYISRNLVRDEYVIFKTGFHWWAVAFPMLAAFVLSGGLIFLLTAGEPSVGLSLSCITGGLFSFITFFPAYINYETSEFGVTNRRILIKTGLLNRNTLEMNLSKVESFRVEDTLFGRLMGFNNLVITGSGGTKQKFSAVRHGKEFRRHVVESAT